MKTSTATVDELVKSYASAAREHGSATLAADYRRANRAYKVIASAYRELRKRGIGQQRALITLVESDELSVRLWAASHALEFAPSVGEPVLTDIAKLPGPFGLDAETTLEEWRAGRLRFP